jgi:hypothetical protein
MTCAEVRAALDDPANGPSCMETCGPATPPGCDCFGCCELPARSGNFVYLGTRDADGAGTCTYEAGVDEFAATGGDPDAAIDRACRLCTPVTTCMTPCTDFDQCFGEPPPPPLACVPTDPGTNPDGGPVTRPDAGSDPVTDPDASVGPAPKCAGSGNACVATRDCPGSQICYLGCCLEVIPL